LEVLTVAIPLSAKEQLRQALELGHELSIVTRTNADFPDAPPKFWLHCTCGYSSTAHRSKKAVSATMIWHLGKVLAEADTRNAEIRKNGGAVRQNPAV